VLANFRSGVPHPFPRDVPLFAAAPKDRCGFIQGFRSFYLLLADESDRLQPRCRVAHNGIIGKIIRMHEPGPYSMVVDLWEAYDTSGLRGSYGSRSHDKSGRWCPPTQRLRVTLAAIVGGTDER